MVQSASVRSFILLPGAIKWNFCRRQKLRGSIVTASGRLVSEGEMCVTVVLLWLKIRCHCMRNSKASSELHVARPLCLHLLSFNALTSYKHCLKVVISSSSYSISLPCSHSCTQTCTSLFSVSYCMWYYPFPLLPLVAVVASRSSPFPGDSVSFGAACLFQVLYLSSFISCFNQASDHRPVEDEG